MVRLSPNGTGLPSACLAARCSPPPPQTPPRIHRQTIIYNSLSCQSVMHVNNYHSRTQSDCVKATEFIRASHREQRQRERPADTPPLLRRRDHSTAPAASAVTPAATTNPVRRCSPVSVSMPDREEAQPACPPLPGRPTGTFSACRHRGAVTNSVNMSHNVCSLPITPAGASVGAKVASRWRRSWTGCIEVGRQ